MYKPETTHISDHDFIDYLSKTCSTKNIAKYFNEHPMLYEMIPKLIESDNKENICLCQHYFQCMK